ncbi:MAG: hypothetical protein EOS85_15850 [Mesorhizobium sp.]|nr:MAG: hypothetical protein EOS85_15850 [Mesorhizobium sp.]
MTAADAIRTGLLEIIDGIYQETLNREDMHDVFVGFAAALYYASSGNYQSGHICRQKIGCPINGSRFTKSTGSGERQ